MPALYLITSLLACVVLMLMLVGHISPLPFLRKVIRFMSIPFSLAGSNACIPFTLEFCTERLGVPKKLAAFPSS